MELDPRLLYEPAISEIPPEDRTSVDGEEAFAEDVWRYRVVFPAGVRLRSGPSLDAPTVNGTVLPRGYEFDATRSLSLDGIVYVKLRDGRGWVFEKRPFKASHTAKGARDAQSTRPPAAASAPRPAAAAEEEEPGAVCDASGHWRVLELLRFTPAAAQLASTVSKAWASEPASLVRYGEFAAEPALRRSPSLRRSPQPRGGGGGADGGAYGGADGGLSILAQRAQTVNHAAGGHPARGPVNSGGPGRSPAGNFLASPAKGHLHLNPERQQRRRPTECAFDAAARTKQPAALEGAAARGEGGGRGRSEAVVAASRSRSESWGWTDSSAETDEEEKAPGRDPSPGAQRSAASTAASTSAWAAAAEAAAAMVAAGVQGIGDLNLHGGGGGGEGKEGRGADADANAMPYMTVAGTARSDLGSARGGAAPPAAAAPLDGLGFDMTSALVQMKEHAENLLASPDVQLAWYF